MNEATVAGYLITLAKLVKYPSKDIIVTAGMTDVDIARVHLALELDRRDSVFKLRAIVEDWSPERINRELF